VSASQYYPVALDRRLSRHDWRHDRAVRACHPSARPKRARADTAFRLLALIVVILVAGASESPFRYLHEPPVIGEIIAGS
jgi:hypothetical protein